MAAPADATGPQPDSPRRWSRSTGGAEAERLPDEICRYLLAADDGWRAAMAHRDHRCRAVTPATPIPADQQRTLCLVAGHRACPDYVAARAARDTRGQAPASRGLWPIPSTTPIVLAPSRRWLGTLPGSLGGLGQAVLVVLMLITFGAVLTSRLASPDPAASPSIAVSPTATPVATPTRRPTPRPTPSPSAAPSGSPGTSAPASGPVPSAAAVSAAP